MQKPIGEPTRRLLILAALAAGGVATIASSVPVPAADISGGDGPFAVTLKADVPESSSSVGAVLETSGVLEAGGEVGLSVTFPTGSAGQVRSSVTSLATGEANEHDVFDPEGEPSFRIAIPAFEGCVGTSSCGESFAVRFERLEADVTNDLSLEWSIDGLASTEDDADGSSPDGSLIFTVEP